MSYTPINTAVPGGDTLAQAVTKINAGFEDTLYEIVMGVVPGWNWVGYGDPAAPTHELWTKGSNVLKAQYTYSAGNVLYAHYLYSVNGGVTFTSKGMITYAYDANGYATHYNWSYP